MTDINWIAVADRLFSEAGASQDKTASTVMMFLSCALRDGVDAAERFHLDKQANAAADRYAQEACDTRVYLDGDWRSRFIRQFMASNGSRSAVGEMADG